MKNKTLFANLVAKAKSFWALLLQCPASAASCCIGAPSQRESTQIVSNAGTCCGVRM